jgi:hypothetical protein
MHFNTLHLPHQITQTKLIIKTMNNLTISTAKGTEPETIVRVQVYEHIAVDVTIKGDTYTFKTPKAFGGRFYYQFCNDVEDSLQEQYPELYYEIGRKN